MDAIFEKIKADITSRPLISALIVITITAAAMLLTLALATLMNLSAPYDRSLEELNGAHLWLYFNRDRVRARDIEWIENLPGVVGSTGLQYSIESRVRIGDTRVWTSLRVIPLEPARINRLMIQRGRSLAPYRAEILASKDLKDLYQLSVGDTAGITRTDGKEVSLPVIGLAYNPMWDTYRNSQPPYLYITEETMRRLFPDESGWDWSLGVRLADPEDSGELLALMKSRLRTHAIESHTDWHDVRESAIFGAQINFVLLGAFSFFTILATTLVVASSISSLILSQFRQIGMLKAIGFTQGQIMGLYLGQYLVLSLAGSLLGLLLGVVLSPLPLGSVAASLSTTFKPPLNFLLVGLVLSVVPGVAIVATLGSACRGARANIIKAIAVGAEAPHQKPFWGVRLAARLNLPMPFILGLNDVSARPFRSLLTCLNLTLGVIGIVFGLALNETIQAYAANPALLGVVYDGIVTRDETGDARTRYLLQNAPGVEAFYAEYLVEEAKTPAGQSFQVRAVTGDLPAFPFIISQGRFFRPGAYEAIAGQGLLDWLGLRVGDEITLLLDGKENKLSTWRIVGQYIEPVNAGQMLMVDLSTVTPVLKHTRPDVYFLKLNPDGDTARLKKHLAPHPDSDLNLTLVGQPLPDAIFYLQVSVFILAGVLISVALVNVFNTSLLAVREKLRLIGVLKALGMTPGQVIAVVNTTAGLLGFLATGLGIPLGLAFTEGVLAMLSKNYGFGEVKVSLNLLYMLLLVPVMVGVSMLGSLIPGWQAARLSIVSVLRSE